MTFFKILFAIFVATNFCLAETREGIATDLNKGDFLYKEIHLIEKDNQGFNKKITSSYLDKKNTVFAKMVSDFTKNKMIPETNFEDFRFQIKQVQQISANDKELELIHFKNQKKLNTKTIILSKDTVAGQGFDNYIKENFSTLKESKIKFIVLDQLDFFHFHASTLPAKSENLTDFQLKISSFFVSLVVSPITVTYSKESKNLIKYQGLSNIFNEKEKSQEVLISYKEVNN